MTDYTGKIVFLDESSNSGGWWAFVADNNPYDYPENAYILQNGDILTILDPQDSGTTWAGTVSLTPIPLVKETVNGYWIRSHQAGTTTSVWAGYFISELPAKLTTENQVINPIFSDPPS